MDEEHFIPCNTKLGQKESSNSTINEAPSSLPRKAQDLTASNGINASLLCLKCRQAGHIVDKCPLPWSSDELGWFFSPARKALDFGTPSSTSHEQLCERCRDLDLLRLLHGEIPWISSDELEEAARVGSPCIQSIGYTGSVEFWQTCPLCRCLFALTPNPSASTQKVLLFPIWTIHRLEGDVVIDTEEKRRYAKCLLVTLDPSSVNITFSDRVHRGDALCILEEDDLDHSKTLGARQIHPYHLSIDMVKEWLSACQRLHRTECHPRQAESLQDIRLVDVSTREVVIYPKEHCDYLALSYVWGGVTQPTFKVGSVVDNLPQTIQDALVFTERLGKKYLWGRLDLH